MSGPLAFPGSGHNGGMELRDYFAAAAMQGLLAHPQCGEVGPGYEIGTACAAREAYHVADAMLAERAK